MFKSSKSPVKSSSTSYNSSSEALLKSDSDKKQTSPAPSPSQPKNYEAAFGALQASYGFGSFPARSSK
ncbi:hypothetical protein AZE42_08891 [Rhizopogon vesiculosus]|uniref:Uncharacterized protein n=1 Tax=Rhizopogon vesiculosus TaxID=180088 RepID=A0A1J8PJG8_9AGAM|nr:hypothetical protein AZE42_08891 [Rhizopogon vesiculosus]